MTPKLGGSLGISVQTNTHDSIPRGRQAICASVGGGNPDADSGIDISQHCRGFTLACKLLYSHIHYGKKSFSSTLEGQRQSEFTKRFPHRIPHEILSLQNSLYPPGALNGSQLNNQDRSYIALEVSSVREDKNQLVHLGLKKQLKSYTES